MKDNFYNAGILTRLILRRERITSTIWVLLTAGLLAFLALGMVEALDEASRLEMATVMDNPAMVAMIGPLIGTSFGAFYTSMMLVFTALAVVVMNIMLVVRHTRADEEKGRYEVVRSLPTGRLANLHGAVVSAAIVNVALGLVTALAMFALGDESMCLQGSLLWGALLASVGFVFAAITAVFAQLSNSSRGAMGYSFLAMGLFYMMRAIGDVSAEALSLISPLGLIIRAEAYQGNYWWPVLVLVAISLPIVALAYRLNLTRDIDQGFLPDRQGRATGGRFVKGPFGFALKLLKTSLIVGAATIFFIGASYGTIMGDIDGFIEANEFYQQLLLAIEGFSLPLLFVGMINFVAAMMALIPMLLYVLKVRGEEKDHRAELIVATPTSRGKYLASFAVISFASSIVLQLLTGVGLWASASAVLPNPEDFPIRYVVVGNLAYLPALWVMIGLCIFLIGVLPKAASLIWGMYGLVFFLGMFGRMGDILPDWVFYLSPMEFVPQYPMESLSFVTMGVLTAIAAGFTALGFLGFAKRDIGV